MHITHNTNEKKKKKLLIDNLKVNSIINIKVQKKFDFLIMIISINNYSTKLYSR